MTIPDELVVDVFDEAFQRNPYDVLRKAGTQARCARDPFGSLILLRADDFEAVASDRRFGAFGDRLARMLGMEAGPAYDWLSGSLMFLDPPDHTRLRGFVRKEFTPRRVAALQHGILATTDQLLDAALPAGEMEFIEEFASRLPLITICQLLGVPVSDWPLLRDWSAALLPDNLSQIPAAHRAVTEFRDYVGELIRERRRRPCDDLVSALTFAASGGQLTHDELWILITLLVFAGNDTTMGLLANSVYLLVAHPDQLHLIREQPGTDIDGAIEECLRFEPPVAGNGRIAHQDVRLGDLSIEAGQELRLMPVAVNRDPLRFAEPDVFDIRRSPNRHLSFGWGPHLCLGATLARTEARIALPRVLERLNGIELTAGGATWAATRGRTLESLPLTFTGSAP